MLKAFLTLYLLWGIPTLYAGYLHYERTMAVCSGVANKALIEL